MADSVLYGIVLAAGKSLRFGENKLLKEVQPNIPMVVSCAKKLQGLVDEVHVLIRSDADDMRIALDRFGIDVLVSERASEGMGYSIADAVFKTRGSANAWLFALGDMPYVSAATVATLVKHYHQERRITVPIYDDRRGHPVIFPREYLSQLLSLSGDTGARRIVEDCPEVVKRVLVDDPGVIKDVDYRDDLVLSK